MAPTGKPTRRLAIAEVRSDREVGGWHRARLLDCPRKDDERTWLAVRALLLAVALMAGTWHLGAAAS